MHILLYTALMMLYTSRVLVDGGTFQRARNTPRNGARPKNN